MNNADERRPFLTPGLSLALDLVRAAAALVVVLWHAIRLGAYQGPWPVRGALEHDAVIVFFVLSGLVIATAARERETNLFSFAVARFARIVPTAWLSILFGCLACLVARLWAPHPAQLPWLNDILNAPAILLPATFLSEAGHGLGPVWNPPYWSLSYEVTYYAMFACVCYCKGLKRAAILLALFLLALPKAVLLLPVWLMGVGLAMWRPPPRRSQLASAGILLVAVAVTYVCHRYAEWVAVGLLGDPDATLRFSKHFLTDIPMGLGVSLAFVALRGFADQAEPLLQSARQVIGLGARASFPLYLFHYPLLALQMAFGLQVHSPAVFAGEVSLIVAIAVAIGELTERWRIALRSRLIRQHAGAIR